MLIKKSCALISGVTSTEESGREVKSGWGGGGMSRGDKVGEIKEAREDGGVKRWRGQQEERKKEKKRLSGRPCCN